MFLTLLTLFTIILNTKKKMDNRLIDIKFNDTIVEWLSRSHHLKSSPITVEEYTSIESSFLDSNSDISIYLHFPFCEKLCSYCDLNIAVTKDQKIRSVYINSIIEEIKNRIPHRKKLKALHLSGGSPSNLSNLNLEQIFSFLYEHFEVDAELYVSIDAHPMDFDNSVLAEKIMLYKKWRIKEIRLGIEDIDQDILENVNRYQNKINIAELTQKLRSENFVIGGHFIAGLPNQTVNHLERFHEEIKDLSLDYFTIRPIRLSSFNTQNMYLFGNGNTLSREIILKTLFKIHFNLVKNTDFRPSGFGHYTKLSTKLIKNELGFMSPSFQNFLGFGVGSISSIKKSFQKQNPLHLNQYLNYALHCKNSLPDSIKKEIKAYKLNEEEQKILLKSENLINKHSTCNIEHSLEKLEKLLEIKLSENGKLNYLGMFFTEAFAKEIL